MNIYLLEPTKIGWKKIGYDSYDGHVVIAENAKTARLLCQYGDEGEEVWREPKLSTCKKIGETTRKHQVLILSSFRAG